MFERNEAALNQWNCEERKLWRKQTFLIVTVVFTLTHYARKQSVTESRHVVTGNVAP